jgi:hypothetical protein
MQKDKSSQGIILDEKSQEQPADKERAQKASKTKPGHMPEQGIELAFDQLQSIRLITHFRPNLPRRRLYPIRSQHRRQSPFYPVARQISPEVPSSA